MSRSRLMICALFASSALFALACGSSNTTGGTGGTSTSTTTSSSSSGKSTTSSSSSSSGSTGTGGALACEENCSTTNAAGYTKFQGYELNRCACNGIADGGTAMDGGASYPCESVCGAECTAPSTLTATSPCGTCLLAQAAMTTNSACTVKAGLTDCMGDSTCLPFLTCELACAQ